MQAPGSSSSPAYARPWRAVGLAAGGWVVAAVIVAGYAGVRAGWIGAPDWLLAIADVVITALPLVVAVLLAGAFASNGGFARATGIRRFHWIDLAAGLGVGLAARALVEVVTPTTGSLGGPFGAPVETIVIVVVGAVLVAPVVEELFFRGLALRALADTLAGAGRTVAGVVAVLVSTAAFVGLHAIPYGAAVPLSLVLGTTAVGLGCGILTAVTGRLWGAIIAHAVFNGVAVVLLLL